VCLGFALAMAPVPLPRSAVAAFDQGAAIAMQHFLDSTTTARQYSASRRLEASGSGQRAWLDVQTDFTQESGLVYQVTGEGGSGYIRSRVLRSLLDEEQSLIARGGSPRIAISADNYQLTAEGFNEEGLAVVRMRPLRKDRSLIAGRMFLTIDGDLVRVEGRLAKNPSLWVTRVNLVRSYRRINGVPMPVSLDTTGQLRFLGSSALRMTYQYAQVDERDVIDESGLAGWPISPRRLGDRGAPAPQPRPFPPPPLPRGW
jgi:hypothetical protein